jgi:predicted DCC family thiol-disulfide oxidoreductase YuxK
MSVGTALERPQVRALTVLFDGECAVCRASKRWLAMHAPLVELRLVDVRSDLARRRFPELDLAECLQQVTVVTDTGHVYRGEQAFIMCLWALRSGRSLALQMARGRKAPVLRTMVEASAWFRSSPRSGRCDEACQTRR